MLIPKTIAKEKAKFTIMFDVFSGFSLPKRAMISMAAKMLPTVTEPNIRKILLLRLIIASFKEAQR